MSDDTRDRALDALHVCEQVSTGCTVAMAAIGGMAPEIHLALDCADVCAAAHRVLARGEGGDAATVAGILDAAVRASEASAAACGAHADHHEHCRRHAEAARACVEAVTAFRTTL
ncbi:four-helix bundle copper-binding protein [Actinomycetospora flava]|uniref:Four-helix bundle copper-binding protein n=1 Tax=Actinomycetospora flava TaxID=3129232 RepID=A0ABU8MCY2_9PSEU